MTEPLTEPADHTGPAGPVIREAVPADAAGIARTHVLSREAAMPYLPPRKRTDAQVEAWVRDVVLAKATVWVAETADGIVGYAAVEDDLLDALYLLPGTRRQGIGTLLLRRAQAHRPGGLSLFVFQRNTDARAFYTHHGFTVADTDDGSRNMEHEPDMTMRWEPRPAPEELADGLAARDPGPAGTRATAPEETRP
ncbi:GNAT family N-acetyltransferase [Actinacidiphila sp. ITFR-21]|uniref:GNAT family N-acetyltransferase n=1 Tax=Actinacidiphila sp. ITFR-21 TaxID=3075199 RepID=UPI0028895263|nr:GNAT family N-acetyltransferase [Streptomyces sp. ITFR-21]WNI18239.1 GNAT family N-acetyltransferase [Streptomyces sp. ITFR-21]